MLSRIRSVLVVRTGRFPVSGRAAKAGEKETSAKLVKYLDLLPKLLTSRTTSEHHAADFLSTVTNVIHLTEINLFFPGII